MRKLLKLDIMKYSIRAFFLISFILQLNKANSQKYSDGGKTFDIKTEYLYSDILDGYLIRIYKKSTLKNPRFRYDFERVLYVLTSDTLEHSNYNLNKLINPQVLYFLCESSNQSRFENWGLNDSLNLFNNCIDSFSSVLKGDNNIVKDKFYYYSKIRGKFRINFFSITNNIPLGLKYNELWFPANKYKKEGLKLAVFYPIWIK